MTSDVVSRDGGEFLVRGHESGCDIVSEKERIGVYMAELDDIVMSNNTTTAGFGKGLRGKDLPVVVGVGMTVSSHLLT